MMKNVINALVLSLSLLFASNALADSAQAAEKLFTIMQMDKMMDAMYEQVERSIQASTGDQSADFSKKVTQIMKEEMSLKSIKDISVKIYTETFTEKELNDMIAFYQTPTGQKSIEKMPEMMQQTMQHIQGNMGKMMQRIQALAEEEAGKNNTAP